MHDSASERIPEKPHPIHIQEGPGLTVLDIEVLRNA